jgi:hypothetical protein
LQPPFTATSSRYDSKQARVFRIIKKQTAGQKK